MDRKSIGKKGEDWALTYLEQKGYRLQARNYRHRRGEIDLIVEKENRLIFVEVKLRADDRFGLPEEMVSSAQQALIIQTAEHYILEKDWQKDIRFDIIAILQKEDQREIQHFEDAFF